MKEISAAPNESSRDGLAVAGRRRKGTDMFAGYELLFFVIQLGAFVQNAE